MELVAVTFKVTTPHARTRLEVFTATELDKTSSGRQSSQISYKFQRFGDQLHLHHQGDELQLISRLMRLSARGNFTDHLQKLRNKAKNLNKFCPGRTLIPDIRNL